MWNGCQPALALNLAGIPGFQAVAGAPTHGPSRGNLNGPRPAAGLRLLNNFGTSQEEAKEAGERARDDHQLEAVTLGQGEEYK